MTPALFLVYLSTPLLPTAIQTSNPNFALESILMNFLNSSDPSQEELFKTLLQDQINTNSYVLHLIGSNTLTATYQSIYANWHSLNLPLIAFQYTQWTSFTTWLIIFPGLPIDSIPPVELLCTDITRLKQVYQSIVGCINWPETCTWPDIAPAQKFIDSYINYTHPQHYKATVHSNKYITSTN